MIKKAEELRRLANAEKDKRHLNFIIQNIQPLMIEAANKGLDCIVYDFSKKAPGLYVPITNILKEFGYVIGDREDDSKTISW